LKRKEKVSQKHFSDDEAQQQQEHVIEQNSRKELQEGKNKI